MMNTTNNHQDFVDIHRPIYDFKQFEKHFSADDDLSYKDGNKGKWSKNIFKLSRFLRIFTILTVIKNYNIKKTLISDFFSGLIVGAALIPQGLAFGSLTSLPPIYGLYTTFFSGFTFIIFSSSRHLQVGTIGAISVMIYAAVDELESKYTKAFNLSNNLTSTDPHGNTTLVNHYVDSVPHYFKLKIAVALTFWTGIIQMLFSMFRIGKISKYLSTGLMRGFTTGVSFHMLGSQLQHILGIYVKRTRRKYFRLPFAFFNLWNNREMFNPVAFCVGIISLTTIVLIRFQINERFHKQMQNIPIPTELLVVIIGTICSFFLHLDKDEKIYKLEVVGSMPTGFDKPTLPDFDLFFQILPDAILITIVSFVLSMSIADTFAKKHKYKVNPNKELLALGAANTVNSFFNCFACAGSLGSSVLMDSSGGKSQIVTIISNSVLLIFILWVAPLFEKLPKACLGAIILASLINTFRLLKELRYYWKTSKIDFFTWIITTSTIIVLNIEYGLLIGFIVLLFLHVSQRENPKLTVLGRIKNTEIYVDINHFKCSEIDNVKIIRFTDSIFYLNASYFKKICYEMIPLQNQSLAPELCQCEACFILDLCSKTKSGLDKNHNGELTLVPKTINDLNYHSDYEAYRKLLPIGCIILDCSMMTVIDEVGLKTIKEVIDEYKSRKILMYLAHCNDKIIEFMKCMGYYENYFDSIAFLTIHDAVLSAQSKLEADIISVTDGFAYIDS